MAAEAEIVFQEIGLRQAFTRSREQFTQRLGKQSSVARKRLAAESLVAVGAPHSDTRRRQMQAVLKSDWRDSIGPERYRERLELAQASDPQVKGKEWQHWFLSRNEGFSYREALRAAFVSEAGMERKRAGIGHARNAIDHAGRIAKRLSPSYAGSHTLLDIAEYLADPSNLETRLAGEF